jgi:hypothetical protein
MENIKEPLLFHVLLFDSEDRGRKFLRNICQTLPDYTALHPRKKNLFKG